MGYRLPSCDPECKLRKFNLKNNLNYHQKVQKDTSETLSYQFHFNKQTHLDIDAKYLRAQCSTKPFIRKHI